MTFRLRTVRAKLMTLVGLPIVLLVAALPALSWLMHGELGYVVRIPGREGPAVRFLEGRGG